MRHFSSVGIGLVLVGWISVGPRAVTANEEADFRAIFDGATLTGWDGDPRFWSVRDGAITGQTTSANPTKGNTFIIWRGGTVADFELRLQARIVGGNSGIQYRSHEFGKWVIGGYQADFDGAGEWTGTLYEERGRGVLARRGQRVVIRADGQKEVVGQTAAVQAIVDSIKKEDWNDYTICACANQLTQTVNGMVTVAVTDDEVARRSQSGLIALQLHAGPAMTVQFRKIQLKSLASEPSATVTKAYSNQKE